jgi:transposase InsO family protein
MWIGEGMLATAGDIWLAQIAPTTASTFELVDLLNGEVFTTPIEAKIIIEQWRREYNQVRPHSSLDYRPPAPEAKLSLTLT